MAVEWPKGWRRRRLGEVADVNWGDTNTTKASYTAAGFPAFSASGLDGYLPYADFDRTGVVLSAIGADCGKTWLAKGKWSCIKNTIRFWATDPEVDTEFLYWLTRDPSFWPKRGSAQPFISQGDARAVEIAYPPLPEQRAIAHILGTLDDKIELNRRMCETLEAMARALFKAWFVDFEPVRAKCRGARPCAPTGWQWPQHILDLFPDRLVPSELGEIPEGWEVGPLGRFFEVGVGGVWGEDRATSRGSIAVRCLRGIDCHDLAEGRIPEVPVRWVSPKQVGDRCLSDGTVLIEGSGSFCGRSMIWRRAYGELIGEPVVYSNFCKRLDPVCSPSQAIVCWMQMRQAYRDGLIQSFRTGTAFPNFDVHGALASLIVVVPPEPIADAFAAMFELSQRLDLMVQSRTLAALRDALLPKLISGELRVKDAERFLERVAL
ncbi:hypothetical protein HRbin30_03219 [bacterium HR30]|nr:hypothetical protein HRbin30_03219 [bacterium HR30]